MRKAVLATVTAGVLLAGTGVAMAGDNGTGAANGTTAADCAPAAMLTSAQATDAALRAAGGGRVSGMQVVQAAGRMVYVISFVRGDRVRTATVDALTGEVTSIVNGSSGGGNGASNGGASNGGSSSDDDDDENDDDDDDDENDEDDDGPSREGVEGNK
ncbi:PepSY domain-containing protein [Actinoplanes derwentensis]|uniref:Peptidase propeptide and YPEB domain-containing protein n=1 Tax=Actinoplanes derwentensis TaxID=113562 RepID=A0A1H2BAC6_9ACTN|nr:PepSY domain-containing protein [Actinoplanes derwentensis]GID86485.1 hypothetical protein Ade03nite_54090 [Actinoplanes derwentensis]SDT55002.1 Peptidase propeptide and YPEB domain-containing protein [Actinoplanes derwentensis]